MRPQLEHLRFVTQNSYNTSKIRKIIGSQLNQAQV